MNDITRDMIAEAIHSSHPFGSPTPWEKIADKPRNPQVVVARAAADAVIALFSPGRKSIDDVEFAVSGNAPLRWVLADNAQMIDSPISTGNMSEAPATLITPPSPPELCGALSPKQGWYASCTLTPHPEGTLHTWEDR